MLQQSDIENLDSNLENLPKDMYISKLLDLCANSESTVCWYRNVLCSRAKRINECPQGNLVNRESTQCGTSAEKYAKDCFILYMFTLGKRSGIECVFDKNKNTNQSKINLVEIRVIIQSLTQRVTELEEALDSKNKTIASLRIFDQSTIS